MRLDWLRPLTEQVGTWTTASLDATGEDWVALRQQLESAGAPPDTLATMQEDILRPATGEGPATRVVCALNGQVVIRATVPGPPSEPVAGVGHLPNLVPLVHGLSRLQGTVAPQVRDGVVAIDASDTPAGTLESAPEGADVTARGLAAVVEAVRAGKADEVLLEDGALTAPTLYAGEGGSGIGLTLEDALDAGAVRPRPERADAVLVWAMVARGGSVEIIAPGSGTPDGVIARSTGSGEG